MVKHEQPVDTKISQIQLTSSRPFKPSIFKCQSFQNLTDGFGWDLYIHKPYLLCWSLLVSGLEISFISNSHSRSDHLCLTPAADTANHQKAKILSRNPIHPTVDSANHQMAKKLPWTRMGTLIKASSLWLLWVLGEQEEGGRTTLAGHCIVWPIGVTACSPGPNPGIDLRFKINCHFHVGQRFRRHLWEDSGMNIFYAYLLHIGAQFGGMICILCILFLHIVHIIFAYCAHFLHILYIFLHFSCIFLAYILHICCIFCIFFAYFLQTIMQKL